MLISWTNKWKKNGWLPLSFQEQRVSELTIGFAVGQLVEVVHVQLAQPTNSLILEIKQKGNEYLSHEAGELVMLEPLRQDRFAKLKDFLDNEGVP